MNSWANIGDLVFVLGRNNEPVPCKVIKEIGTGKSTQLFFEVIDDRDIKKIPKNRLKACLDQVGYKGGYVFREKQNALDYLEQINTKGSFNVSSAISRKVKRAQQQLLQKSGSQVLSIEKIKEIAVQEAVSKTHKVVIGAMLLALNSKLGVGPKRGAEIVDEINRLIETMDSKEILITAERKMKAKLSDDND